MEFNDRTDIKGVHNAYAHVIKNRSDVTIYSLFNKVTHVRGNSGRQRGGNKVKINCEKLLKELLDTNDGNPFNFARKKIMALTKQQSKDLYLFTIRNIEDPNYNAAFNEYFMIIVKDICLFKLQRYYEQTKSNNVNFLIINFSNRLIENVNFKSILKDPDVASLFPHTSKNMIIPNISYSYTKTISSDIVNYRQTIQNLDSVDITCSCNQYDNKYINSSYGHILTGNLVCY